MPLEQEVIKISMHDTKTAEKSNFFIIGEVKG
jgi:hypothetical protein